MSKMSQRDYCIFLKFIYSVKVWHPPPPLLPTSCLKWPLIFASLAVFVYLFIFWSKFCCTTTSGCKYEHMQILKMLAFGSWILQQRKILLILFVEIVSCITLLLGEREVFLFSSWKLKVSNVMQAIFYFQKFRDIFLPG
jgi:hypothetical protein